MKHVMWRQWRTTGDVRVQRGDQGVGVGEEDQQKQTMHENAKMKHGSLYSYSDKNTLIAGSTSNQLNQNIWWKNPDWCCF